MRRIALATNMLYLAAIPYAYDIAIGEECHQELRRQKLEAEREFVGTQQEATRETPAGECSPQIQLTSKVKRLLPEKNYGFILARDGRDYFFHLTDLLPGLEFDSMVEGLEIDFEVKSQPAMGRHSSSV